MFHGVRQLTGIDNRSAVLSITSQKMSLPEFTTHELINAYRFILNNAATNLTQPAPRVAPVIVKFVSKGIAKEVFKAKAKLTSSVISVAESLTKQRRDILNAAKDKFGQKNV